MAEEPLSPQMAPYQADLEEGKNYFWCACGRSKKQPFCDGSHKGTGLEPVKFTAKRSGVHQLCGCKATGAAPICDGSHNML